MSSERCQRPGGAYGARTAMRCLLGAGLTLMVFLLLVPAAQAVLDDKQTSATTLVAGRDADWTFTFQMHDGGTDIPPTTSKVWPKNGSMLLDFPAGFDLTHITGASVSVASTTDSPAPLVSVDGQTVNVTRRATTTGEVGEDDTTIVVTIAGIHNGAVGATGTFSADLKDKDGGAITSDNFPGKTITQGTLTASLAVGDTITGAITDYVFTVTPGGNIGDDALLDLRFPLAYELASIDAANITVSGTKTGGHVGGADNVTIALGSITAGAALTVTIPDVPNPLVASAGSPGDITVRTTQPSGIVDEGTATGPTLVPLIPQADVRTNNTAAGGRGTVEVHFRLDENLPSGGHFNITFPAGFSFDAAGHPSQIFMPGVGTSALTRNGLTVTATIGSVQLSAATDYLVQVTNVTNPAVSGDTGIFTLASLEPNYDPIEGRAQDRLSLTPGPLSDAVAAPDGTRRGQLTDQTFQFNTTNAILVGDRFKVQFPAGYVVPGDSDGDRVATASVTQSRAGGSTVSFTVAAHNPDLGGTTGTFTIWTERADGRKIDQGTASGVSIVEPSVIPSANFTLQLGSNRAGQNHTLAVSFTPTTAVDAGGKIALTLPAGFRLNTGGATALVAEPTAGGTLTVDAANRTATIRLLNNPYPAGTAVNFSLSNIGNPLQRGAAGTFSLSTWGSDDGRLDRASRSGPSIVAGSLTGLSVNSDTKVRGENATYSFGFTTATAWPADGRLTVQFPAGFTFRNVSANMEGTGAAGTLNASLDGSTLTLSREGTTRTWIAGAKSLTVSGIVNPDALGATGTFRIVLLRADGGELDVGTFNGVTILEVPDRTPPTGRITLTSSTHIQTRPSADACPVFIWNEITDADGSDVTYHWAISTDEGYVVTEQDDNVSEARLDLCSVTDRLPSGVRYFHVKARSDGGLGADQTPFVLNIVRISAADLASYIRGVTLTVEVRDDGNFLRWTLPDLPLEPMGVQVWRSSSPYTLLETIESSSFTGEYLDTTVAPGKERTSRYLVTIYFGLSQELGWYSGVGSIAPDTADFPGQTADDTWGWWVWLIIINALLVILALVLLLIWLVTRKGGKKTKSAEGLIDLGAIDQHYTHSGAGDGSSEGSIAPAGGAVATHWPQDMGGSDAPDWPDDDWSSGASDPMGGAVTAEPAGPTITATAQEHDLTCPACSGGFTVEGSRPLHTTCPHCGVSGVLN